MGELKRKELTTGDILDLARKHLGSGDMESSARLCLADAVRLYDAGRYHDARVRALKSVAYSVGVLHEDYQGALDGLRWAGF